MRNRRRCCSIVAAMASMCGVAAVVLQTRACVAQTADSTGSLFNERNFFSPFMPDTTLHSSLYGMNRAVDSYGWNINTDLSGTAGGLGYLFSERMNSTFIPVAEGPAPQMQNADARMLFAVPAGGNVSLVSLTTASGITNNQNIGVNDITRIGTMAGLSGLFGNTFRVAALGGAMFDSQIGRNDKGGQYLLEAQLAPTYIDDYIFSGNAISAQEYISPRRNQTDAANLNAEYHSPEAIVQAHIDASHAERDFYFNDSLSAPYTGQEFNIEQRFENNMHENASVMYLFNSTSHVTFDGEAGNRTITLHDAYKADALPSANIDTRITQFSESGGAALGAVIFSSALNVHVHYDEFDETHGVVPAPENSPGALTSQAEVEAQKNFISRHTELSGDLAVPLGADSLRLASSFGVLHYNAPDTNNHDDRDQLDAAFHISYRIRHASLWAAGIYADMFLRHLVYLLSEESGNNSWNRIIRLAPYVDMSPSASVQSRVSCEVLANYSVYDFAPLLASVQSYSFREINIGDSTVVNMTSVLQASAYASLRWYEHGTLDWNSFSERPVDRNQEWTYGGAIREALSPALSLSAGIHIFTRFTYQYAGGGAYAISTTLKTFGPNADIFWNAHRWGVLHVAGWYEFVLNGSLPTQIVPNITMTVAWNL